MSWPWANWASDDESDGESYADAVERVTAGERAEREGKSLEQVRAPSG